MNASMTSRWRTRLAQSMPTDSSQKGDENKPFKGDSRPQNFLLLWATITRAYKHSGHGGEKVEQVTLLARSLPNALMAPQKL